MPLNMTPSSAANAARCWAAVRSFFRPRLKQTIGIAYWSANRLRSLAKRSSSGVNRAGGRDRCVQLLKAERGDVAGAWSKGR